VLTNFIRGKQDELWLGAFDDNWWINDTLNTIDNKRMLNEETLNQLKK
jgi:hypothetical protein